METTAHIRQRETPSEAVDSSLSWIVDPGLTRPRENLYSKTIDLHWHTKTLLAIALQEQKDSNKELERKIDSLTEKFVAYVKEVHHMHFIDSSSPHYAILKRSSTARLHQSPKVEEDAQSPSKPDCQEAGPSTHRR